MNRYVPALTLTLLLAASPVFAWSNHSLPAYRAFEKMPEVANAATVTVETLEDFLKAEEVSIEPLLASQEAWASSRLEDYPARPLKLAFSADPKRTDAARRLAFLTALRVAPDSKFALYFQPDPRGPMPLANTIPHSAVNTLPEDANSTYRFVGLKAGDQVAPLAVIASASDEPDYGLDINLWDDSPSQWGKTYGFGTQPFGNPSLSYSTQAPFHMGFFHESSVLYMAAPFIKRTFPLLRSYQYSTLAELAFRTGHAYWGWRFTGLSLHYLQDLTQPYHARLAPGESTIKLLGVNVLAMAGLDSMKNDMVVLLSNRHLALERYQSDMLEIAARSKLETTNEKALNNAERDHAYPAWSDHYLSEVVSSQSASYADRVVNVLLSSMPTKFVSDPAFDFGANEAGINMMSELAKREAGQRAKLDSVLAELMGNFGTHSRNAVRGILKGSDRP